MNGIYGTNIPAGISNEEIADYIDIFYSYSKTRNSDAVSNAQFQRLDTSYLNNVILSGASETDNIVEGLYNLRLPINIFGKKGFYTIYIKPKEVPVTIADVGTLTSYPNIRGIVLNTETLPSSIKNEARTNGALAGYRIIYKNNDGTRSPNHTIVTSNNLCEPVTSASTTKTVSYRYNENSSYTFLTVTPSTALSFKSSSTPFIGKASQEIYLVNTLFEPLCIELEMVDHDMDTISTMLEGSQLRNLDNGIITTFDNNGDIYHQADFYTLKESATNIPQYEVKKQRTSIDSSQTLTDKA